MTEPNRLLKPVVVTEKEAKVIKYINKVLGSQSKILLKLVGNGEEIEIPESITLVLRQVIHLMDSGQAVSIVPLEQKLTIQAAADFLNVSQPFLGKLLEQGIIPYLKVDSHRYVQFEDLMAYKRQREQKRRQSLKELTQFSQEEGFYLSENTNP